MKKTVKILLFVAVAGIASAAWYFYFRVGPETSPSAGPSSMVAPAERRNIESTLLLTGEVVPAFLVDIKAEVGGKVKKLHAVTGQFVHKGDPLVTIDDTDIVSDKSAALTEIAGAQLSVDKTRGNFDRAKALYEQKLISKEVFKNLEADYAISQNSLDKAKAKLRTVEDRLRKTLILAPSDGTLLDVLVNEGQVVVAAASVNSGTVLINFADLSRLLINSHVNQVDVGALKTGQEIDVNVSGSKEGPLKARIEFIAPVAVVKNNIKGFEVQALILDDGDRLKPGMSVSMNVPVAKASDAVAVPVNAVFRDSKETVVYVRKSGGVERRKVQVGITDFGFAEIRSGLEVGEEILLVEPTDIPKKS